MTDFNKLQPHEKRNVVLDYLNTHGVSSVSEIALSANADKSIIQNLISKLKKLREVESVTHGKWIAVVQKTAVSRIYSTRIVKEPKKDTHGSVRLVKLLDNPPYPRQGGQGALKTDIRRGCSLS